MIFPLAPKCLLTEGRMIFGLSSVFFVLLLACYLTVLKHLDQPAVMIWCYITKLECFQLVCLCVTAPEMLLYLELFMLYHQAATAQLHIWFISLFTGSRHFRVDTGLISILLACSVLSLLWIMPLSQQLSVSVLPSHLFPVRLTVVTFTKASACLE